MMKSGTKAKRKLDFIIDHNSDMQNIREVVYHYHVVVGNGNEMQSTALASETSAKKKEELLDRASHFLHRYCMLLVLAEYFEEHLSDEKNPPFSDWITEHEEYRDILNNITLED